MALARVVTFDGVSRERMDELNSRMESGEPPEGFPSSELIVLNYSDFGNGGIWSNRAKSATTKNGVSWTTPQSHCGTANYRRRTFSP